MQHVLDGFHFAEGEARFCPVNKKCPHCGSSLGLVQDLSEFGDYFGCWNDKCEFPLVAKKRYGCVVPSEPDTPELLPSFDTPGM